ncbi:hypothetical protein D9M72_614570 [compost metagenome]
MRDVLVLDLVGAKHVHGGQHLVGGELAFGVLVHIDLAQGERGIGRLGAGFGGKNDGGDGRHQGMDLHLEAGVTNLEGVPQRGQVT